MFDYKPTLVTALETILPTYYEYNSMSDAVPPCITYAETSDTAYIDCDNYRYCYKIYTIKIWGADISSLSTYIPLLDTKMLSLGFKRNSYNELAYDNGLCLVFTYQGLGRE